MSIIDELYAPDYVSHIVGAPGPVRGREALKHLIAAYFAAFDIALTSEFLVAEGEMVAAFDTFRLRHTGAFQGIPATGKEATLTSTDIYRIVGGEVAEQWVEANMLSLLQQLDLLPHLRAWRSLARRGDKGDHPALRRGGPQRAPRGPGRRARRARLPGPRGLSGAGARPRGCEAEVGGGLRRLSRPARHDRRAGRGAGPGRLSLDGRGDAQGELLGVPPTGNRVRFSGISICRVREGRMVETHEESDRLGPLRQLGAVPASGHSGQ